MVIPAMQRTAGGVFFFFFLGTEQTDSLRLSGCPPVAAETSHFLRVAPALRFQRAVEFRSVASQTEHKHTHT